jgi:TonB-dependent starch-binding outer membrane protein SusC
MKKLLGLLLLIPVALSAQLSGNVSLSGRVVGERNEGLTSASIAVKGSDKGTISDSTGRFSLVINHWLLEIRM